MSQVVRSTQAPMSMYAAVVTAQMRKGYRTSPFVALLARRPCTVRVTRRPLQPVPCSFLTTARPEINGASSMARRCAKIDGFCQLKQPRTAASKI